MNKPRHNVCDHCGRNAHKVALRIPATSRGRFPSATKVVGLCPSCFADAFTPRSWRGPDYVPYEGATCVYDRRGRAARAAHPMPERMLPVPPSGGCGGAA